MNRPIATNLHLVCRCISLYILESIIFYFFLFSRFCSSVCLQYHVIRLTDRLWIDLPNYFRTPQHHQSHKLSMPWMFVNLKPSKDVLLLELQLTDLNGWRQLLLCLEKGLNLEDNSNTHLKYLLMAHIIQVKDTGSLIHRYEALVCYRFWWCAGVALFLKKVTEFSMLCIYLLVDNNNIEFMVTKIAKVSHCSQYFIYPVYPDFTSCMISVANRILLWK